MSCAPLYYEEQIQEWKPSIFENNSPALHVVKTEGIYKLSLNRKSSPFIAPILCITMVDVCVYTFCFKQLIVKFKRVASTHLTEE